MTAIRTALAVILLGLSAYGSEAEIRKAEAAWAAAVKGRDAAALEALYAPELIYAHSTGVIENKQQYMARFKSGAQRYDDVTQESLRVVVYGGAAVAQGLIRMRGNSSGREFNDHLMVIHMWVKQDGAWRLAAHQTTKLAE